MHSIFLYFYFSFPNYFARVIETSLAQFAVLALSANVSKIVNKFDVDDGTRVAAQIVDYFVPPQIVNQYVAVRQARYQQLPVVIESRTQSREILFHRQAPLQFSSLNVVQQQTTLVAIGNRTNERRFRWIAQQCHDPRSFVLNFPYRFAISSIVQLNQSVVIAVQKISLILRYPIQGRHGFVRICSRRRKCRYGPAKIMGLTSSNQYFWKLSRIGKL